MTPRLDLAAGSHRLGATGTATRWTQLASSRVRYRERGGGRGGTFGPQNRVRALVLERATAWITTALSETEARVDRETTATVRL